MLRASAVRAIAIVGFALILASAHAADEGSAAWLFLKLTDQAELEARAAAKHGDTKAAGIWRAWERQYGESAVSPALEGKSALDITAQLATSNTDAAARAHDPRETALERASAVFWRGLHAQLAAGGPLTIAFPRREMLTPVPGLKGTPWDASAQPTAADCAQLAQRVRFCEAQGAQMAHENATGLYGDRSFPLLMQQHSCHRWEEMRLAYCGGR
jgi:hypothetical protein